jgi:hypothetical protein
VTSIFEVLCQAFEVLADTALFHMEAFGIAPDGDIPTHALGQRSRFRGEVGVPNRSKSFSTETAQGQPGPDRAANCRTRSAF